MAARALPIVGMRDESRSSNIRLVIALRSEADPPAVQAQLARQDDISAERAAQFPAPPADLLRAWVAARRHQDIIASLHQVDAAIRADQLEQQECWK
jgi:hypothetical protein